MSVAFRIELEHAIAQAQALALRAVADQLEHDQGGRELLDISFAAA